MGTMTTVESPGRFTRADFERLPEDAGDGLRYELLDGAIVVTPAPGFRHQKVVVRLLSRLDEVAPDGLHVLVAPLDVYLPTDDILQPDVLVVDEPPSSTTECKAAYRSWSSRCSRPAPGAATSATS